MKKTILLLSLSSMLLISGCGKKESIELTGQNLYAMPEELSDCKIFQLNAVERGALTVVRCPLSTTSTSYLFGKVTQTVVVSENAQIQMLNQESSLEKKMIPQLDETIEVNGQKYKKLKSSQEININGQIYQKLQ